MLFNCALKCYTRYDGSKYICANDQQLSDICEYSFKFETLNVSLISATVRIKTCRAVFAKRKKKLTKLTLMPWVSRAMSSEFSSTVTDSNLNTRGGARTSVMSHVLQVKLEWEQRSQRSKPPMLTELWQGVSWRYCLFGAGIPMLVLLII